MVWILIVPIIIILLYIFLICPSIRRHPLASTFKRLYVAHRGLHDIKNGIPENSIAAYKNAIKHGYDIEIDVHLTKDGQVVVFHDDTLNRVCGIDKKIKDMTLDELSNCRLLGTNEYIPSLEDVLNVTDGKVCLVIEYKCGISDYKQLCVTADKILQRYKGRYIVQSFNPLAMGWYKRHRPDIFRGQLSTNFLAEPDNNVLRTLVGTLLLNVISRPHFLSYSIKYTNIFQRKLCIALGAISAGWTFSTEQEYENYKDKYDIYIFEGFVPKIK